MSEEKSVRIESDLAEIGADLEGQIESSIRLLSRRQLVLLRFKKNRLAVAGFYVLVLFYIMAIFAEFISPYDPHHRFQGYVHIPPSRIPHSR